MKTSDVDLLIIPGWQNSGPDHWQTRWERSLKTARRVHQADWEAPRCEDWVERIVEAAATAERPVVFIAHSLGNLAVAHAAHRVGSNVVGAFLVAPSDWEIDDLIPNVRLDFVPIPMRQLPFPSVVIASTTDPYCTLDRARAFAAAWGSTLIEAEDAGHINTESGHGPWPDGLLRLGWFLKQLG